MSAVTLHHGDSRDVLKGLADASIDSVCTDPPYALVSIGKRFGAENAAPSQFGKDGAYQRASAGFMGKKWDTGETAFAVEFWAEVLRVLKPGGHVVAFGGTRTVHRLTCAIEDAGFEIRDLFCWVTGQGFPKSTSPQYDMWKGVVACQSKSSAKLVVQLSPHILVNSPEEKTAFVAAPALILPEGVPALLMATGKEAGLSDLTVMSLSVSEAANMSLNTGWSWLPSLVESSDPRSMFTTVTNENLRTNEQILKLWTSRTTHACTTKEEILRNGWSWPAVGVELRSNDLPSKFEVIPILTAVGRVTCNPVVRANGTGSSMKPAIEPIVLARKPLVGTVAANVMAHGTGALNIDASRVEGSKRDPGFKNPQSKGIWSGAEQLSEWKDKDLGRWPANLLHDGSDEVVACFPDRPSAGSHARHCSAKAVSVAKGAETERVGLGHEDNRGSAARFFASFPPEDAQRIFYSAKANAKDRAGSKHPTVKPIKLIEWLIRLVTPPGGTVLDPFAGSGTCGQAARNLGFDCVLVEREDEYVADIRRRLNL